MNEAIKYLISPVTHFDPDSTHGLFETYIGIETKKGVPGSIHYKVCGRTEEESRSRAMALGQMLTTVQSIKK